MRAPRALSGWWLGILLGSVAVAAQPLTAQPVAVDDAYEAEPVLGVTVDGRNGVLANDSPGDDDDDDGGRDGGKGDKGDGKLAALLVSPTANGTLLLASDGGFVYVPNPGFTGNDTFTYRATSGKEQSNVATVTIAVAADNVAPVAAADSYSTDQNQALDVNARDGVLANDTDVDGNGLTAVLVSGASSGTVTLNANGSFGYAPAAGFTGNATFTYQADDGSARSDAVTVTITVRAVNGAPTARADSYTTAEDTPLSAGGRGVLDNDADSDGDALTAERVTNVRNGTLQLNPDGTFTYTPAANFSGTTSFTYRARDGSAASEAATVTITVSPVNDVPFVTSSPARTAAEGVTYRYSLAASDPDGDSLTIAAPTLPSWLEFTAPATISGTPRDVDAGDHDVTMTVADGIAPAVELKFRIAVAAVDNAPALRTIPEQTATEGSAFDLDLAQFVTDGDTPAGALEYAATRGLPRGLALSAGGRLSGTPAIGGSVGAHTVEFTVADETTTVPGLLKLVVLAADRVDLAAAVSVAPNPATLDTPVEWTIAIANRAVQVEAKGVALEALFVGDVPLRFDAVATPGCTLAPSGDQNRLSCTLGQLAGGGSTSVKLTGRGSFAGDVFAAATVAVTPGGALDEMPGNDRATASLSIAQRIAGAPAQSIALPGANAVAAGDFDGDGFDELAVATASAQGLVILTNVEDAASPGRRTFATTPMALGGEPLANGVAAADLDNDGDLDLVTAAGNGAPNRAFLNEGGAFSSVSLGDETVDARAVAVGDINGDAFVDLVFASPGTSTVLIGSGGGAGFRRGTGVGPHAARDALLADLDGDALPELVLANADGDAAVYANRSGAFTLAGTLATGPTSAVATGDFNGDGRPDLVFARASAEPPAVPSAHVWLKTANADTSFFVSDELGAAATTDLLVDDFNLDSRADVLAANGYAARLFTNAGAANGTFALNSLALATPGARGAAMGRFSSDERVDLAFVGDEVDIFVNDGGGGFGQPDSTPPVIQLRGAATVDVTIDSTYSDAGATATDAEDGDLTSRIVVTNTVDLSVLGTYTVTYAVTDSSGNAAVPVKRTVNVRPQPAVEEGGGGALGPETLALLLAALLLRTGCRRYRARRAAP